MPAAAITSTAGAVGRRACPSGISDNDDADADADEYPAALNSDVGVSGIGSDYVVVTQDELRAHTVRAVPLIFSRVCVHVRVRVYVRVYVRV